MSAINEVEDEEKNIPLAQDKKIQEPNSKKIKCLYFITVAAVLLIVVSVAVIVIFFGGKSKGSETDKNNELYLNSSFEAIYEIYNENEDTKLFNENLIDKISSMVIDNKTVNISNISNTYQFDGEGKHKVVIELSKKLESTEEMFKGATNLISIIFKNFQKENLKSMSGMFWGCNSLTSLDFNSFNTKQVTNMSHLFYGCSSLTNISLDIFDTSNVTDMKFMFSGCRRIGSLNLKSFNTKKLKEIKYMFNECSHLTNLEVGPDFIISGIYDLSGLFYDCIL